MSTTPESSGSPILTVPVEIPDHLQKPVGTPGPRLLEIERAKASFSPRDLELYLYGKDYIERRDRILPVLENEVSPWTRLSSVRDNSLLWLVYVN